MERWQKKIITKHLPELIENTRCSTSLLAKLVSRGILGNCDLTALAALLDESQKSNKLFEIIQTRRNAYEILQEILLIENQTGAAAILQKGCKTLFKSKLKLAYDKKDVIGIGCHNTKVYKGKFGDNNVAIKVISLEDTEESRAIKEIVNFKELIRHSAENIVRYYFAEQHANKLWIAMELCHYNLAESVKRHEIQMPVKYILYQTAKGIQFLHHNKIIHLDLIPENILLKHENGKHIIVKIADFGISKTILEDDITVLTQSTSSGLGTLGWMAPETQKHGCGTKSTASFASDIFSLGCIFYYVITKGKHPFGNKLHITANIDKGEPQLDISHFAGKFLDFCWLIYLMIIHNRAERPTIDCVLSNPVFWSTEKQIKLIADIGYLLSSDVQSVKSCASDVLFTHESIPGAESIFSNTWTSQLCTNVQSYIASTFNLSERTSHQLFISFEQLYTHFNRLPEKIQLSLGNMHGEFMDYWSKRFPFLISSAWLNFSRVKTESRLNLYYDSSFDSYYGKSTIKDAIQRSFLSFNDVSPMLLSNNKENDTQILHSHKNKFRFKKDNQKVIHKSTEHVLSARNGNGKLSKNIPFNRVSVKHKYRTKRQYQRIINQAFIENRRITSNFNISIENLQTENNA